MGDGDYGLLGGIARGFKEGIAAYDTATERRRAQEEKEKDRARDREELERKSRRDQDLLDMAMLTGGFETGEDGKPRLSKAGRLKRRMDFHKGLDEYEKASPGGVGLASQIASELNEGDSGPAGLMSPGGLSQDAIPQKSGLLDFKAPADYESKADKAFKRQMGLLDARTKSSRESKAIEDSKVGPLSQIKRISDASADQANIYNMLTAGYEQITKPGISEDEVIRAGNELIKVINSPLGKDAVGAEEAGRLGGALKFQILNLTGPGKVMGRDLEGFKIQLKNAIERIHQGIRASEEQVSHLQSGEKGLLLRAPKKEGGGFPRKVYKGGEEATVSNEEELQDASKKGWK